MRVEVVPYNSNWPQDFRREAALLEPIFASNLLDIHHIGSTSVPGLQAKPIIDMMPVVTDIEQVDALDEQMQALGYRGLGEFGIPGRRYFRKGEELRTHHIHVFATGDSNVLRHLAFRNYLRAHAKVAAEYGQLKAQLAKQFPSDIESYMDGKDALIKQIEAKAIAWYEVNGIK